MIKMIFKTSFKNKYFEGSFELLRLKELKGFELISLNLQGMNWG